MRKLLFVYPYCGLGGVETSIITKTEALKRVGIDASVLFTDFYGEGGRTFLSHPAVTVTAVPEHRLALLRRGFDAISIVDYPDFLDTIDASDSTATVMFETHTAIPTLLSHFYSRLNHPRIRRIVVPSRHNARLIQERANPAVPVVVIPNGINQEAFAPRPIWQRWLQRSGRSPRLVLWVGRLENEKNPAEFVDIAELLMARNADVRFVLVGDAPDYEECRSRLLARMSVPTQAAFEFRRIVPYAEMPGLYRRVAESGGALVSTSRYESLPMIFLEAMASGCPVVSSDVGGVGDLIMDQVTGRLYTLGQAEDAAAALVDLMSETARLTRGGVAAAAVREIRTRYSLAAVSSRYVNLLSEMQVSEAATGPAT